MTTTRYWFQRLLITGLLTLLQISVRGQTSISGIGYLMDVKGGVSVLRDGAPVPTTASCILLAKDDVVSLGADDSATVLMSDRAYVIKQTGKYRIAEPDVVEVKGSGESAIEPALGMRGTPQHLGGAVRPIIMPPKMLFASVKPPVMRAVTKIEVLSPCGQTLSATPDLVWTGPETNEYTVQVVPISIGEAGAAFPTVSIVGCKLNWNKTGWPSLGRDESYRVVITRQGEVLTDSSHVFHVIDAQTMHRIEPKIAAIEKDLPEGVGRKLAMISQMIDPNIGLYAEARLVVVDLLKKDPKNVIYLRLMQRCYAGMGSAQGFMAVEKRLNTADSQEDFVEKLKE